MISTITIHIPIKLKRRGGRKMIIGPQGHVMEGVPAKARKPDETMVRALIRSWKWQLELESGSVSQFNEICARENIDPGSASKLLRLNILAPDIKEAILDGTQPRDLALADLLRIKSDDWELQRAQVFGREA